MDKLRIGLIGTGYWARVVHGASAAAHPRVELVGLWGRNPARRSALATDLGVRAYDDADSLIEDVDALTFAVPPDVQAEIAIDAAGHGKHVLLEKPIAISVAAARRLEETVAQANVASVVFFTQRFVPETQAWLERLTRLGGWQWGRVETLSHLEGGPFAESPWRHEYGALWDIGPHALALLCPVLGEVTAVVAGRGRGDHVHLIMRHADENSSSASLSLTAPRAAIHRGMYFDGEHEREVMPAGSGGDEAALAAHGAALDALADQIGTARPSHPCDVHFGARVVEVLAAAQESLQSGSWVSVSPARERV